MTTHDDPWLEEWREEALGVLGTVAAQLETVRLDPQNPFGPKIVADAASVFRRLAGQAAFFDQVAFQVLAFDAARVAESVATTPDAVSNPLSNAAQALTALLDQRPDADEEAEEALRALRAVETGPSPRDELLHLGSTAALFIERWRSMPDSTPEKLEPLARELARATGQAMGQSLADAQLQHPRKGTSASTTAAESTPIEKTAPPALDNTPTPKDERRGKLLGWIAEDLESLREELRAENISPRALARTDALIRRARGAGPLHAVPEPATGSQAFSAVRARAGEFWFAVATDSLAGVHHATGSPGPGEADDRAGETGLPAHIAVRGTRYQVRRVEPLLGKTAPRRLAREGVFLLFRDMSNPIALFVDEAASDIRLEPGSSDSQPTHPALSGRAVDRDGRAWTLLDPARLDDGFAGSTDNDPGGREPGGDEDENPFGEKADPQNDHEADPADPRGRPSLAPLLRALTRREGEGG